jgi:UDP-N-acetylglucosamine 2-epimerase
MKILTVIGARPQFIKAAPVQAAFQRHGGIEHVLVHTGQHYDYEMSKVFFEELGLPEPDHHLEVGSGTHAVQTGRVMERLEPILEKERPRWVLVYGDTNSTLAGALTAAKLHLPVAHVEAGLRSFNKAMPEEINRILADHVATLLLCPTAAAVANLEREGFHDARTVRNVGDVMYDAALLASQIAENKSDVLTRLGLQPQSYRLATIHRAENTDDPNPLREILTGLGRLPAPVILPMHPRTTDRLRKFGLQPPANVRVIPPVGYFDMLLLEKSAALILTDSGGVQKEAYFFRVPCVTMRRETEWVETVATGWNTLTGADADRIAAAAAAARPGQNGASPYGDGHAADRIVADLDAA